MYIVKYLLNFEDLKESIDKILLFKGSMIDCNKSE